MIVTIVDYGMGNLASVAKAVEFLGHTPLITSDPQVVVAAEKLILPGVGAFARAMQNLKAAGLDQAVVHAAQRGIPLLGICLGMQLLMDTSTEYGLTVGLGLIPGIVQSFRENHDFVETLVVPHMGWNSLVVQDPALPLWKSIPSRADVYFVHSYYVQPANLAYVAAVTPYGIDFCSAVQKANIYGMQFHPEKSGGIGLQLLHNFLELI